MKKHHLLLAIALVGVSYITNAQIGIGTTSPSEELDIESNDGTNTSIDINNTGAGDPLIHFQFSNTAVHTIGVDDTDDDKLKFGTTAVETGVSMTIDGSQNVGIGTESPVSGLDVQNSMGLKVTAIGSATTLDNTHNIVLCSGAAYTATLPAAGSHIGKVYYIKNVDAESDDITIDGNGGETIDGDATVVLYVRYDAIRIVSDGTEWHIIDDERIPHKCILSRDAVQSISDVTITEVSFDAEVTDVGELGATGTGNSVTIKRAGTYVVTVGWTSGGMEDQEQCKVLVYVNGSNVREHAIRQSNGSDGSVPLYMTFTATFAAGDYIDMFVRQATGSAQNTNATLQYRPRMSVVEVR